MVLTYADNHTWRKTIHPDIFPDFGKSATKKLLHALQVYEGKGIRVSFQPLESAYFEWFTPLYQSIVATKENFGGYKLRESTLDNPNAKYQYHSMTVYENEHPIGGAIFTLREDRLSIAYRTFPYQWLKAQDLRCTPSLLGEYFLNVHAHDMGKSDLVHGADRNLYGLNSAIGLAIFKLSVGCTPRLQKTHSTCTIDTNSIPLDKDVLVFEYPPEGTLITSATLVTTADRIAKHEQVLKYPDRLNVTPIIR